MRKSPIVLCTLFIGAVLMVCSGHTVAPANKFIDDVSKIATGGDTASRGNAIIKRLDELGIPHRLEPFTHEGNKGVNIIAELPGSQSKTLLVSAHYDRVAQGKGAVDNASGDAVVLELLEDFKSNPLKNYHVYGAFFDLEELGLFGSKEYVVAHKKDGLPSVAVNFDVFGYGDTLWVMTPNKKTPSAVATKKACDETKFPLHIGSDYPDSDHESFVAAKVETLGISLIDGKEIAPIYRLLILNERPSVMPRLLTFMHSPGDTIDKVDGDAALKGVSIVNKSIRAMDGN